MMDLARLKDPDWLLGADNIRLMRAIASVEVLLHNPQTGQPLPRRLLIQERDPVLFLGAVWGGYRLGYGVFLGDPAWGHQELSQALRVMGAGYHWREGVLQPHQGTWDPVPAESGWLMIPTGGSSGQIRFAIHTLETLRAAVLGLQQFVGIPALSSLCVLPLHHVSGWMQVMRAYFTNGQVRILPWKQIEQASERPQGCDFISLVPTQLQRLVVSEQALAWLRSFRVIWVGGAPLWPDLRQHCIRERLPIALSYGMTETAAQIATLLPEGVWAGEEALRVLPHAQVQIQGSSSGGPIQIKAGSLALGYYPDCWEPGIPFISEDWGQMDPDGRLRIRGRQQDLIISGGENVFAADVEAALWAIAGVWDVCVIGIPDPEWGEQVAAAVVLSPELEVADLPRLLKNRIHPAKIPKQWQVLDHLPRNAQGKLNRDRIRMLWDQKIWEKDN